MNINPLRVTILRKNYTQFKLNDLNERKRVEPKK